MSMPDKTSAFRSSEGYAAMMTAHDEEIAP